LAALRLTGTGSPQEAQKTVATHGVAVNAGGGSGVIAGKGAGANVLLKNVAICSFFF